MKQVPVRALLDVMRNKVADGSEAALWYAWLYWRDKTRNQWWRRKSKRNVPWIECPEWLLDGLDTLAYKRLRAKSIRGKKQAIGAWGRYEAAWDVVKYLKDHKDQPEASRDDGLFAAVAEAEGRHSGPYYRKAYYEYRDLLSSIESDVDAEQRA